VICWKNFIAIKIKYIVKTFSPQKKFFVIMLTVMINKIVMLNIGFTEEITKYTKMTLFAISIVNLAKL